MPAAMAPVIWAFRGLNSAPQFQSSPAKFVYKVGQYTNWGPTAAGGGARTNNLAYVKFEGYQQLYIVNIRGFYMWEGVPDEAGVARVWRFARVAVFAPANNQTLKIGGNTVSVQLRALGKKKKEAEVALSRAASGSQESISAAKKVREAKRALLTANEHFVNTRRTNWPCLVVKTNETQGTWFLEVSSLRGHVAVWHKDENHMACLPCTPEAALEWAQWGL
jgi:hypothetical protein